MKRLLLIHRNVNPWNVNPSAITVRRLWWLCWYIELLWEPRDLWIGVYWTRVKNHAQDFEAYICLLPCLPIRVHVWDDSDVPF